MTIQQRFLQFHQSNPQVYDALVVLARKGKARGATKLAIGRLFEVMRWEMWLNSNPNTAFKLDNNYRSRYARLIMQQEADLAGMFELRNLRSK